MSISQGHLFKSQDIIHMTVGCNIIVRNKQNKNKNKMKLLESTNTSFISLLRTIKAF